MKKMRPIAMVTQASGLQKNRKPSTMRSIKLTLLLISSLTVMAGAIIAPALPLISDHFQGIPSRDLLTKLILTVPALFIAITSPFAGYALDRFGKVRLLLGSMVLYAIAGSSGLYLENIYAILVGRAFLGISVSFSMTGATALVGDYLEGQDRANFLGLQGAFMAFGGTVFVTLAGLLADMSWRYPFGVYLSALFVLTLSAKVLFEPTRQNHPESTDPLPTEIPWFALWPVYLTIFLGMVLFYVIPVQSPFLMRSLGAENGLAISSGLIGGTFLAATASFFYNRIKVHLFFNQIYAILFIIIGTGFLLIGISGSILTAALSTALAGLGAGLLMPNTSLCLLSQSGPQNRGRIMSGMTGMVFLGQFFSPLAFQPLLSFASLQQAHLLAGLFAFFISAIYIVVLWKAKKAKQVHFT